MAAHLGLPVRELASRITFQEFLNWVAYLDWEEEHRTKLDVYLASIAAEVRRSYHKHPNQVKLEHFHPKFTTNIDPAERAKKSKAAWLGHFGINPEEN